jgi:GNAT superfamily N-acetyltransferase
MSTLLAESLFGTAQLEMIYLSPALAADADKAVAGAPKFFADEFDALPEPGFVADLLEAPPPPGVSRVAVFPIGIREKNGRDFIGLAHMVIGYPTETELFIGLLLIAEASQRKGYGREFMQGIYAWGRSQGIVFVRVRVRPRHTGARAFLDKLGFADLPNKLSTGHEVWQRKIPAVEE